MVINLILTPIIIKIAHNRQLFDKKDFRKTHIGNIPRLGGIGFFTSSVISMFIIYLVTENYTSLTFSIALTLVFISGLIDDLKPIRASYKLIIQILATIIIIIGGHTLSHIFIPFLNINLYLGVFQYPMTFLWIIGVTNAINLLDGMDGQAGGVSILGVVTFSVISLILGRIDIAIICLVFAGALIGFLRFNLPPAKIFMGDGGSLVIGFFLATLPLLFSEPEIKGKVALVAVAVLLIPILDVFAAIIRRTRLKISLFEPDRGHIHHKFTDFTSLSTKQILIFIYAACILSGTLATLFITNTTLFTQLGLIINLFLHLLLFAFLHNRKKRG